MLERPCKKRRLMSEESDGTGGLTDDSSADVTNTKASPAESQTTIQSSFFSSEEMLPTFDSHASSHLSVITSNGIADFRPEIKSYIPVGCIRFSRSEVQLDEAQWANLRDWKAFAHPRDGLRRDSIFLLSNDIELKLSNSTSTNLKPLHQAGWVRLEAKSGDDEYGQIRVYILPDDIGNREIDRSDRTLRKCMQTLLPSLDISKKVWDGLLSDDDSVQHVQQLSQNEASQMSLLQLFNTLPSPQPDISQLFDAYDTDAMTRILEGRVQGLRTEMLPYQKRSAAMMLQKESAPGQTVDPRLSRPLDQNGKPWYCDITTGSVVRDPRMYEEARGGICAETMGLGKTLICLSLILATRETPTHIPVEYSVGTIPVRKKVGSLLDMSGATVGRSGTPWRSYFQDVQRDGSEYTNCLDAITRGAGYYLIPGNPTRVSRNPVQIPPRKVYLSATTLVVVPANLVKQWEDEIEKHTEGLNVLVMNKNKDILPDVESLAQYDLILFSKPRFELEAKDGGEAAARRNGASSSNKRCYNCNMSRGCDCLNQDTVYTSPLKSLHFKRLIMDEGHVIGNASNKSRTNAVVVVDFLQISARWIISGTPTPGLYGFDVSPASEDPTDLAHALTEADTPNNVLNHSSLTQRSSQVLDEQERKDLEKLGNIAKFYLKTRPWSGGGGLGIEDVASWATHVMQPQHGAKSHGNFECLRNTLESMIIRHRPDDVEADLVLPPLHQKSVLLEPSYQDKLSINMFSLMITSNAVTSERKDADYLFHPSQHMALRSLVDNLRQASFFWSGFVRRDVEVTINLATDFLEKEEVHASDKDKILLRSVVDIGNAALKNNIWIAASENHEMPMHLQNNFPGGVRKAWALDGIDSDPTLIGATQLRAWQKLAAKQLNLSQDGDTSEQFSPGILTDFKTLGTLQMQLAKASSGEFERKVVRKRKTHGQQKVGNATIALAGGAKVGGEPSAKKKKNVNVDAKTLSPKSSPSKKRPLEDHDLAEPLGKDVDPDATVAAKKQRKVIAVMTKRLVEASSTAFTPEDDVKQESVDPVPTLPKGFTGPVHMAEPEEDISREEAAELLSTARLISTSSSKLSYLMTQVLAYASAEKIIIFYEADNVAYYIAQALEALHIEHLIYAKTLNSDRRSRYLHTFIRSDFFRVLLMDVSQAAFGLDISVASRVYFVNPLLNKQVEAQAVKRAHRIGQKRPVHVETLVLKHTIEEMILKRRGEMSSEEQTKVKTVLDDNRLYEWIRNVRFVPMGEGVVPQEKQMAVIGTEIRAFGRRERDSEKSPDEGLLGLEEREVKSKRKNRGTVKGKAKETMKSW